MNVCLANCRLTQPMGIDFDKESPAVVLPEGLMCPFNSQNTLFDQKALWGTLIPITTSFRVCDIWRGYWVQASASSLCLPMLLDFAAAHKLAQWCCFPGSPQAPLSVFECVKMCTFLPQNKMRVKCGAKMRLQIIYCFYSFAKAWIRVLTQLYSFTGLYLGLYSRYAQVGPAQKDIVAKQAVVKLV